MSEEAVREHEISATISDGGESIFAISNLDADIKSVEEQIAELTMKKSVLGYELRSLRALKKNAQRLKDAGFLKTSTPIDGDSNQDVSPVDENFLG